MKNFITAILLLCGRTVSAQTDTLQQTAFTLDSIFKAQLTNKAARGISFTFVKDGRVCFKKGYGFSDMKLTKPVDPTTTVFSTASVSKIFGTLSLLQLQEKGKCKITDDVNLHLPNYKLKNPYSTPVTIFDLMTHTAGFEDKFMGGLTPDANTIIPLDKYFERAMPEIVMEPNTQISYSNHGGALLGLLAEEISGVSYDKYVQQNIFTPLGMLHSSFFQPAPENLRMNMVQGEYPQPYFNPYPAGACVTTADDMGKLIEALLNNGEVSNRRILSVESINQVFKKQWSANPAMPGMGLGFMQSIVNREEIFFHTGDAGQHSILLLIPKRRMGLYVAYTNIANGSPREDVVQAIMNKYFSSVPFQLPKPPNDFSQRANEYEGTYRSNQYSRTTFEKLGVFPNQFTVSTRNDNTLFIEILGGRLSATLTEVTKDLFISSDSAYFCFVRNRANKIEGIQIAGNLSDPSGFEKIGWFDNVKFHAGIFVFVVLIVLTRVIWSIINGIKKIFRKDNSSIGEKKTAKIFWLASSLLSWLLPGLLVASIISIVFVPKPIYALPWAISITLITLKIIAVISFAFLVAVFLAWRKHWWSKGKRIYFSIFSWGCLGLSWLIFYWNL